MKKRVERVLSIYNIFEACLTDPSFKADIEKFFGTKSYESLALSFRKAAEKAQDEIPPTLLDENVGFFISPLTTGITEKIENDFPNADAKVYAAAVCSSRTIYNEILEALGRNLSAAFIRRMANILDEYTKRKRSTAVSSFCYSMMAEAEENDMPFIGREDVIERTIRILNRKVKHNVIHIGEAGVGKTSCTVGLARKILAGDVPEKLKDLVIYSVDVAGMMAGTKYRGEMEERLKATLDKLEKQGNVILYIDEIQTIVGTGSTTDSSLDIANILKPYLTRGKLRVIGSATLEDYRNSIEKDKALNRRFQTVTITEPTEEEAKEMLFGLRKSFEDYHKLTISDGAVDAAVKLSAKHIRDKFLPDKAVDLIDEAASTASLKGMEYINEDDILDTVSRICRIPSENLQKTDTDRLRALLPALNENVFGQETAAKLLNRCILSARAGLSNDRKPVASLLFVGPTGVGKTEMARVLAKTLDVAFIKYDMSEYSDKTAVNKLIGASAGYVGYEEGGRLVHDIRENPYCVLLLDEIEKADSAVFNALLQIMDDSVLTDSRGDKADFTNVILIMTSNCGAADARNTLGFAGEGQPFNISGIDEAVKRTFSPEFRSRLTSVVSFNSMNKEMAEKIAEKELENLTAMLKNKKVKASFSKTVIPTVLEKTGELSKGGREIIKVCAEIKELFVEELLFGALSDGGTARVNAKNNEFSLTVRKKPERKIKASKKEPETAEVI